MLFAAATIVLFVVVDWSMLPMVGIPITEMLTVSVLLSLLAKGAGAFLGAYIGSKNPKSSAEDTS